MADSTVADLIKSLPQLQDALSLQTAQAQRQDPLHAALTQLALNFLPRAGFGTYPGRPQVSASVSPYRIPTAVARTPSSGSSDSGGNKLQTATNIAAGAGIAGAATKALTGKTLLGLLAGLLGRGGGPSGSSTPITEGQFDADGNWVPAPPGMGMFPVLPENPNHE